MARNMVIDGDYKGKNLKFATIGKGKEKSQCVSIELGAFKKDVLLIPDEVATYDVITEDHQKSAASGVAKGLVGNFFLGPVGLLAGAASGGQKGTYNLIISFKDGKQSLLEVGDLYYNTIVEKLALLKYREQQPTPKTVVDSMNEDSGKAPESLYEQQHHDQIQFQAQSQSQPQYQPQPQQNQALSAADEILKYKQLLDDGVITKKEFEKKKKQLLKK
ncbi:MAG: SHOCT domain-containing protein [Lachnospiraceae bacterium]|nr:SHOCT domain-containing protein [Lachnospiraceae bacterium]